MAWPASWNAMHLKMIHTLYKCMIYIYINIIIFITYNITRSASWNAMQLKDTYTWYNMYVYIYYNNNIITLHCTCGTCAPPWRGCGPSSWCRIILYYTLYIILYMYILYINIIHLRSSLERMRPFFSMPNNIILYYILIYITYYINIIHLRSSLERMRPFFSMPPMTRSMADSKSCEL